MKINYRIFFSKIIISIINLWNLILILLIVFLISEIIDINKLVSSKGVLYESGINKLIKDGGWNNITKEEEIKMFTEYQHNFTEDIKEITKEDFLIAELDFKSFSGRFAYTHPFILIFLALILCFSPNIIFHLLKRWIHWLTH